MYQVTRLRAVIAAACGIALAMATLIGGAQPPPPAQSGTGSQAGSVQTSPANAVTSACQNGPPVSSLPAANFKETGIPPTPGFDPYTASESELMTHGYPLRPSTEPGLAAWKTAISNMVHYIPPDPIPSSQVVCPLSSGATTSTPSAPSPTSTPATITGGP